MLIRLLLILLPMYIANSSALVLGGGKTRLDGGKLFIDKKPILGKGKTLRGTILGILTGFITAILLYFIIGNLANVIIPRYLYFGFLTSIGAILGDIVASFYKRRVGFKPGEESLFLDQLDFVAGGLVLSSIIFIPTIIEIVIIVVLTLIVHRAANYFAYKIKLKKVPW